VKKRGGAGFNSYEDYDQRSIKGKEGRGRRLYSDVEGEDCKKLYRHKKTVWKGCLEIFRGEAKKGMERGGQRSYGHRQP